MNNNAGLKEALESVGFDRDTIRMYPEDARKFVRSFRFLARGPADMLLKMDGQPGQSTREVLKEIAVVKAVGLSEYIFSRTFWPRSDDD